MHAHHQNGTKATTLPAMPVSRGVVTWVLTIAQVKLATLATLAGPNSGRPEGSAPSSARSKTPRDEASQGPLGLRSPNQRQRKVRRSDSTSEGPATARSRSSGAMQTVLRGQLVVQLCLFTGSSGLQVGPANE